MTRLPSLRIRQSLFELALIAIFAIYGLRAYANFDPGLVLEGNEAEWLTSSAQYATESLHKLGYLPLWQPYLSRGEPTIASPFAFVLNPFQTLPSLLLGYPNGVKVSIMLSAVVAGWGGWYLARVLGLGLAGRLLLGLLFAVKGPQHAAITQGYIQLGITQSYLPWVAASALALVKFRRQRYPVVLLAGWITLLFFGGNIYYTLPGLVLALSLAGAYLLRRRTIDDPPRRWSLVFDTGIARRLLLALALTVGFAAVTLLPMLLHASYIGRHANIIGWGQYADLTAVLAHLFAPEPIVSDVGTWNENYYIYTMPPWFAFIVFLLLPVLERALPGERQWLGDHWRVWGVGVLLFAFFTTWGAGSNAIIGWMYEHLPLIGRWRNVNRMLTLTSFWTAVFAALLLDRLWQRLEPERQLQALATTTARDWARAAVSVAIGALLILLLLIALWETVTTRKLYGSLVPENALITECVNWIRSADAEPLVSVWMLDYYTVSPFLSAGVRVSHINADYDPLGSPPTLFSGDLSEAAPAWVIPYRATEQQFYRERGWSPVADSPPLGDGMPCAWRNPNALNYVFTIPYATLASLPTEPPADLRFPIDTSLTTPVSGYEWSPGRIRLAISNPSDQPQVLVVQDVAWPGWVVRVDGQPARLESVGQLIGVVVPPHSMQTIEFEFTAPLLHVGALISGLTVLLALLYLLRAERWLSVGRATAVPVRTQTDR